MFQFFLRQFWPVLSARNGAVEIAYPKSNLDGVEIRSKRGGESESTLLTHDTKSPYVDTRPNLVPGPETRYYQV